MRKILISALITTCLFTQTGQKTRAETCTWQCGPKQVQFVPGQMINFEIINLTASIVRLEKIQGTDAVPIYPGQKLVFTRAGDTVENSSVVFWDVTGLPIIAKILKPNNKTLRIELRAGGRPPGDRSVYMQDDGRVSIF